METTPRDLWRSWRRRRDSAAFEALVRPELRYAADFARRLGATADEAEDFVQESLVKLAAERTDSPVEVGVRAWLCRRVVMGYRMHVRSAVRRRNHEGKVEPHGEVADPTRRPELREEVEAALRELDEGEREVVLLRFLHDLDYSEIAYVLGATENACRIRVHRAMQRLRRKLGRKASAFIALLGIKALPAEAGIVAGAVATAKTAAGLGILGGVGAKVAAGVIAAAAVTTTAMVLTSRPERPPTVAPAPTPPPRVAEAPPPVETRPPRDLRPAGLALLDDHFAGKRDATRTLWSYEEVAKLVKPRWKRRIRVEASGDPTDLDFGQISSKADIVELGPGRFRMTATVPFHRKDVFEVRGAGMGRTVVIAPAFSLMTVCEQDLQGLVLRDLTFQGNDGRPRFGGEALDVRLDAVGLFDGVRFVGTASGGYSAPVGVAGRALLAFRRCEFVGGYRRAAGGCALNVRGDVLALFESCLFADLDGAVMSSPKYEPSPLGRIHLSGCRFENTPRLDRRALSNGAPAFAVESRDEKETDPVRCTLGALREALLGYRPRAGERTIGIEAVVWRDGPPPRFVVHALGAGGERVTRLLGDAPFPGLVPPDFPTHIRPKGETLLAELEAAWPGLDPDLPAYGLFEGPVFENRHGRSFRPR